MSTISKKRPSATWLPLALFHLFQIALIAHYATGQFTSASHGYENDGGSGYITVIEDQGQDPSGILVATSENFYAVYDHILRKIKWVTFSRNEDEVSILQADNSTRTTVYQNLTLEEQKFVANLVDSYKSNLEGIKLEGHRVHIYNPLSSYKDNFQSQPPTTGYGPSAPSSPSSSGYSSPTYNGPSGNYPSDSYARPNGYKGSSGAGGYYGRTGYKKKKRGYGASNYNGGFNTKANSNSNSNTNSNSNSCQLSFNYYNLHRTLLNDTLDGDIYHFDMGGNIKTIYSNTVGVLFQHGISALYRDYRYFAYSRPYLPLSINRFLVSEDFTFIVYNDGTVRVKQSSMLDDQEMELVVQARRQLKSIGVYRDRAAKEQVSPEKHEPQLDDMLSDASSTDPASTSSDSSPSNNTTSTSTVAPKTRQKLADLKGKEN